MRFLNKLIKVLVLAVVGAGAAVPAAAQQACTIRVESLQGRDWRIKGFDVFDRANPQAQFIVTFTHVSGPACRFIPRIGLPDGVPGLRGPSGELVAYTLLAGDNNTGLAITGSTLAQQPDAQGAVLTLEPGQATSLTYNFFVPIAGLTGDGLYEQNIEVSALPLAQGGGAFGVLLARLSVEVVPSARLGLAGMYRMIGNQAVIDLGDLATGPVGGPLQLQIRSTRQYELAIESRHGGKLVIPNTEWAVTYGLSVAGVPAPLSGGISVVAEPSRRGLAQAVLPLEFTITGDPSQQRAGQYEDTLTISVTAKL